MLLCEHIVWDKLPASAPISVRSTVIVATQSRARPRNVLVGHVIMLLWGKKGGSPETKQTQYKGCDPEEKQQVSRSPCITVEELSSSDKLSIMCSFSQQR